MSNRLVTVLVGVLLVSVFGSGVTYASDEYIEGKIVEIIEEKNVEVGGIQQVFQKVRVRLNCADNTKKIIETDNNAMQSPKPKSFNVNDKVVLLKTNIAGEEYYIITDFVRRGALVWLFLLFIFLTVLVGKKQGLYSILGTGFSFLLIFKIVLPNISNGANPVLIILLSSILIIPVTFYLSHGISKKTHVAIAGTFLSLVITSILALIFVKLSKLSGFSSDEAMFLQLGGENIVNIRNLLLSGIIIGTLGILDDVTISQAAIVYQLKKINSQLSPWEIFEKSMSIGKDHISSMINTLILVYAGASFPLLLMFTNSTYTFPQVINYEIIAEEIVRTLVGSIGLVLAVPITTLLATRYID